MSDATPSNGHHFPEMGPSGEAEHDGCHHWHKRVEACVSGAFDHLKDKSCGQVLDDCIRFVRQNPLKSTCAAFLVGLLAGRIVRRR